MMYKIMSPQRCGHLMKVLGQREKHSVKVVRRVFHTLMKNQVEVDSNTCLKTDTANDHQSQTRNRYIGIKKIVVGIVLGYVGYKTLQKSIHCEDKKETCPSGMWKEKLSIDEAIAISQDLVLQKKDEIGCPGMAIAVSVDGQTVWSEGFGFADVENRVPCSPDSVMRIASVSKPIATTLVAKQMEEGKLDIDKPVQYYVPNFPQKTFGGKQVTITTRQVLSHMSGIRNYNKDYMEKKENKQEKNTEEKKKPDRRSDREKKGEFYLNKPFHSVSESLKLFQDDPLVSEPGTKYLYTSHGWTLLSAVMEGVAKKPFEKLLQELLKDLGMENTYMEKAEPLIYNRARCYSKNAKGKLVNAPTVDLSYKWAAGGLISTVGDVVKFGNIILYSSQWSPPLQTSKDKGQGQRVTEDVKAAKNVSNLEKKPGGSKLLPGYLGPETVRTIWKKVDGTGFDVDPEGHYAMGWAVVEEKHERELCEHRRYYVSHTGGSVGASSILLILPPLGKLSHKGRPPKGVVVAMMANLQSSNLNPVAKKIAKIFEKTHLK